MKVAQFEEQRPGLALVPPLHASPELWEAEIAAAEFAAAAKDFAQGLALLEGVTPSPSQAPRLALRMLLVEASARSELGETGRALASLEQARSIAEGPDCDDADRAAVFFELGRCRLALGSVANAVSLFTVALELCDRSALCSDRLRVKILDGRSRCYQRQRDWDAAREDVERGVELAQSLGDASVLALILFQASIVAERQRMWPLARCYAEEALTHLTELGDSSGAGKVLNNLGGINFLLGDIERATTCLLEAARIASDNQSDLDLGYALSSLSQLRLRTGDLEQAEADARRALELLAGRSDHPNELGNAGLVLARTLLEQGRFDEADAVCAEAESALKAYGSTSHTAAAWIVRGDIARRSGNLDRAADLYRKAAETLQDTHF